jgi:hypothetical protein
MGTAAMPTAIIPFKAPGPRWPPGRWPGGCPGRPGGCPPASEPGGPTSPQVGGEGPQGGAQEEADAHGHQADAEGDGNPIKDAGEEVPPLLVRAQEVEAHGAFYPEEVEIPLHPEPGPGLPPDEKPHGVLLLPAHLDPLEGVAEGGAHPKPPLPFWSPQGEARQGGDVGGAQVLAVGAIGGQEGGKEGSEEVEEKEEKARLGQAVAEEAAPGSSHSAPADRWRRKGGPPGG